MKCLTNIINDFDKDYIIITSKLGCGLGGLNWLSVKKILEQFEISNNMIVCNKQEI